MKWQTKTGFTYTFALGDPEWRMSTAQKSRSPSPRRKNKMPKAYLMMLWKKLAHGIIQFVRSVYKYPEECRLFEEYLWMEELRAENRQGQTVPGEDLKDLVCARNIAGLRVYLYKLPKDLRFWVEVHRYRHMLCEQKMARRGSMHKADLYKKACNIIALFYNSVVEPAVQINVTEERAAKVISDFNKKGAVMSLFHSDYILLFPVLFNLWKVFQVEMAFQLHQLRVLPHCRGESVSSPRPTLAEESPTPAQPQTVTRKKKPKLKVTYMRKPTYLGTIPHKDSPPPRDFRRATLQDIKTVEVDKPVDLTTRLHFSISKGMNNVVSLKKQRALARDYYQSTPAEAGRTEEVAGAVTITFDVKPTKEAPRPKSFTTRPRLSTPTAATWERTFAKHTRKRKKLKAEPVAKKKQPSPEFAVEVLKEKKKRSPLWSPRLKKGKGQRKKRKGTRSSSAEATPEEGRTSRSSRLSQRSTTSSVSATELEYGWSDSSSLSFEFLESGKGQRKPGRPRFKPEWTKFVRDSRAAELATITHDLLKRGVINEDTIEVKKRQMNTLTATESKVFELLGPGAMSTSVRPLSGDVIQLGQKERRKACEEQVHLAYIVSKLIEALDAKRRRALGLPPATVPHGQTQSSQVRMLRQRRLDTPAAPKRADHILPRFDFICPPRVVGRPLPVHKPSLPLVTDSASILTRPAQQWRQGLDTPHLTMSAVHHADRRSSEKGVKWRQAEDLLLSLLNDKTFVDYFNVFLCLPTVLACEYRLSCKLRHINFGLGLHDNDKDEQTPEMLRTFSENLLGSVAGMHLFRQYLQGKCGARVYACWMHVQMFYQTRDPQRRTFILADIKRLYLSDSAIGKLKKGLAQELLVVELLSFEMVPADVAMKDSNLCVDASEVDLTSNKALRRVHSVLLDNLRSYWVPCYVMHVLNTEPRETVQALFKTSAKDHVDASKLQELIRRCTLFGKPAEARRSTVFIEAAGFSPATSTECSTSLERVLFSQERSSLTPLPKLTIVPPELCFTPCSSSSSLSSEEDDENTCRSRLPGEDTSTTEDTTVVDQLDMISPDSLTDTSAQTAQTTTPGDRVEYFSDKGLGRNKKILLKADEDAKTDDDGGTGLDRPDSSNESDDEFPALDRSIVGMMTKEGLNEMIAMVSKTKDMSHMTHLLLHYVFGCRDLVRHNPKTDRRMLCLLACDELVGSPFRSFLKAQMDTLHLGYFDFWSCMRRFLQLESLCHPRYALGTDNTHELELEQHFLLQHMAWDFLPNLEDLLLSPDLKKRLMDDLGHNTQSSLIFATQDVLSNVLTVPATQYAVNDVVNFRGVVLFTPFSTKSAKDEQPTLTINSSFIPANPWADYPASKIQGDFEKVRVEFSKFKGSTIVGVLTEQHRLLAFQYLILASEGVSPSTPQQAVQSSMDQAITSHSKQRMLGPAETS
ncbi:hypothetical protein BaRGS_00006955 [Batillaria attramentaria]|uniref:Uncharacterized protein n=1 Tax=Batillaria attramentaria TaxID=370345 RepID=A0ABD0LQR2_9CAEN